MSTQRLIFLISVFSSICSTSCFITPSPFGHTSLTNLQLDHTVSRNQKNSLLHSTGSKEDTSDNDNSSPNVPPPVIDRVNEVKKKLIRSCEVSSPSKDEIVSMARKLEEISEQAGIGQGSSFSGLMSGEWELLYSSGDKTRSSPFFWAFRKAFPEKSDQVFSITDAIPPPIKEIGPATQTISLEKSGKSGTLISRVEVASLAGYAKSTMTTRCTILGPEGYDGIVVRVDTTKPEKWTILQAFGKLGESVIEQAPPFPSGEALERVRRGSSEVLIKTTFCDETLRISRNGDREKDIFVWRRKSFPGDFEI